MVGRVSFWTAERLAQLRTLAASGASVDHAAGVLGKSRVSVRSKATQHGISFRHAINHGCVRVLLPPDLVARAKLVVQLRGDTTVQKLCRDILHGALAQLTHNGAAPAIQYKTPWRLDAHGVACREIAG
jgi:hypothetical protein